jgi:glycosyltransferase involved in cell wall biosynthesis
MADLKNEGGGAKRALIRLIKRILTQPLYDKLKYHLFLIDWSPYIGLPRRAMIRRKADKVSILIPSHTRVTFLREAVQSALEQTYENVEVLVMTDAPEAGAEDVLRDCLPRIRFFSEPGLRRSSNLKWNALAQRAEGDLLILLCDDDMLDKTFVEKTLYALKKHDADIVYTDMKVFGTQNTVASCKWDAQAFPEYSPIPITSLFKRSVYDKVGGYADIPCTDWDFWWTASEKGARAFHVGQPLFFYRTHAGQDSNSMGSKAWEEARILVKQKHGVSTL